MTSNMAPPAPQDDDDLPPPSDNVDEEVNRIRLALATVYSSSNTSDAANDWFQQRQRANRYLTRFQTTPMAWMVCDRLLWQSSDNTPTASFVTANDLLKQQQYQFFAAQTLHTKCRSDQDVQQLLSQGGSDATQVLGSLRDSLLQHLNRSVSGSSTTESAALTTRLAMCLSALAVQMQWTTILYDLLQAQQQQQQSTDQLTLLFLIRALPEECASDRLYLVDDQNRYIMRDHLIDASPTVFEWFLHHLTTQQPQAHEHVKRVLQAWHGWIRYVPVRPQALAETPLLPATVQALVQATHQALSADSNDSTNSEELVELSADVVVEVLRLYPSHGPPDNHVLVHQMLTLLLPNLPVPAVLATAATADNPHAHVVRDYCRVLTELGESYTSWILSAVAQAASAGSNSSDEAVQKEQQAAFHVVDWILQCSSQIQHDPEVAAITLPFWYRLVMDLEETQPLEWRQELLDAYWGQRYLLPLVSVCVQNLMKFPADVSDADADQADEIHRHRYHVAETVEDCCRLLGGTLVLQRLAELLQSLFSNPMSLTENWQGLESCLSCLVAIHKFVPDDEDQVLPFVFGQCLLPLLSSAASPTQQNSLPPPLQFTVCKLIGKFARWLAVFVPDKQRSDAQTFLSLHASLLLPFLAQSLLTVSDCAPAAAIAIKELCVESNPLGSFAMGPPVLELYEQQVVVGSDAPRVDLRDELVLLEGVCIALSQHIHVDTAGSNGGTAFLQRLVQPMGTRLAANVNSPTATPRTTLPDVERLATVVQHLKVYLGAQQQQHPIVELMQSLWSYLESLIVKFPNDANTAEQVCRLHKHALRACGPMAYAPLAPQLMGHYLVEAFGKSHQSPFLYAASICVSEYGSHAEMPGTTTSPRQYIYTMVEALSNQAFSFCPAVQDFSDHPDVVEELFYLHERMVQHCPDLLLPAPLLSPLMQAALACLQVDHHGAHKGTVKFWDSLLSHGVTLRANDPGNNNDNAQQRVALEHALSVHGNNLVANLVRALMGEQPAYSPKIAEILWKLSRLLPGEVFGQWLANVSVQAQNDFRNAMSSRDDFLLAARGFQNACQRRQRRPRVE